MDYIPTERPAIIAQANERLIAEYHRSWGKLIDTGLIDQMPCSGHWAEMTTWSQDLHLFGKPSDHKVGRAFFLVSDPKHRLIQEVGYEGAKPGSDPWRKEAEDMLNNIQFVKERRQ